LGLWGRICFCKSIWLDWEEQKVSLYPFWRKSGSEFSMSMFNKDLYPTVETFKYPKAERRIL
jgi:hypothetical protein